MLTRRFLFIALAVLAGVGGAAAWYLLSAPSVAVVEPRRGPAVEAVYATGVVEPVTWAKVTPMVRGRIVEHCACEGDPVAQGAFLTRLDNQEQKARVAELEARERYLRQDAERYRELQQRQTVSPQVYERAVSEHRQVVAAIAAAKERLADYTLRAPIDGIVLRRDGEVGEIVEPGQAVVWVGKPKPLWIVAEVDEEDIPRVRLGQRTLIKADAFAGRTLEGTVKQITPKGDPVNKSYRVRIALPDDTPLLIGMTTEINIVVAETADAVLLPAEAVIDGRVFVVDGDRARARKVTVGVAGTETVEIRAGLSGGEKVIAAPPKDLADGQRVRESRRE